jgi:hypothetical protein
MNPNSNPDPTPLEMIDMYIPPKIIISMLLQLICTHRIPLRIYYLRKSIRQMDLSGNILSESILHEDLLRPTTSTIPNPSVVDMEK